MKESIGASWIFVICLTFILIFTAYVAISVNYAKAFRLKTHIVSEIEENEGYNGELRQELETYLTAQGYASYGTCEQYITVENTQTKWELKDCIGNAPPGKCGACIYRTEVQADKLDDIDADRVYYRGVTFFQFDLPVLNVLMPPIKIAGDSQYIYEK